MNKVKYNTIKIAWLFLVAVVLQSCDKVNPPYKKDVVVPVGEQKVLVEDFTGHKCGNCPRATRAIYDLKSVYGDKLIIIAVHAGTFATVLPPGAPYYTYDFRNAVSTELDTDFGVSVAGNPNGMVNRRLVDGSYIVSPTKWGEEVANVLNSSTPVPVKISIDNTFTSGNRQLKSDVTIEYLKTLTGSYKLSVYMVEDSIINWQKDYDVTPDDNIPDYVHREVLRGSMNGTYGDVVSGTTEGNSVTLSFSSVLDAGWNENHFSVVAFLYDATTKEILQVEQEHMIP